jgi:hypothetical protein
MGLMQKFFGGGNTPDSNKGGLVHDGSHSIDKSKVLAATDASVISPQNPGKFGSIRSVPVVPAPRYFTRDEADKLKDLAKEKTEGAVQAKRAYKALGKIEESDAKVHKLHRKYEGTVADNELVKKRADARLGKRLHTLRPSYARLGMTLDQAATSADTRISDIKAKLQEAAK